MEHGMDEGIGVSVAALPGGAPRPASSAAAAAGELYVEHAPLLRRIAVRKFNVPPADAEALVHDVFINYLVSARNVRTDVRAYLIGAICNASRNYWRSRKCEARVFAGEEPDANDAVTPDLFDGLASHLAVASTLARLGARCREVLKRYYLEGQDTPAIAAGIDTSCGNVNYLMHVCRKRARAVYESLMRKP